MEPQAVWAVIAGVLILALGVFFFAGRRPSGALPNSGNPTAPTSPSGLYRISTKFGGICFMAAGLSLPFCLFSPAVAPILLYAQDRN